MSDTKISKEPEVEIFETDIGNVRFVTNPHNNQKYVLVYDLIDLITKDPEERNKLLSAIKNMHYNFYIVEIDGAGYRCILKDIVSQEFIYALMGILHDQG